MTEEETFFLMEHFRGELDGQMRLTFDYIDAFTNTDELIQQAAKDDQDLLDDIPIDWENIGGLT